MPIRWTLWSARATRISATALLLAAAWVAGMPLAHGQTQRCTPLMARVVSLQGTIALRSAAKDEWQPVRRLDTPLCLGDRLRTGANSRAALFIPPENLLRVDQNTTVSVRVEADETIVEFFIDEASQGNACGAGYAISRFPRKFKLHTPFSYAAVEGTEFLVAMTCSSATVSVFEGKVSVEQRVAQATRVVLESGQTTTVGPAQPPAVQVLVKPADAVQWALYYPPLADPQFGADPIAVDCEAVAEEVRPACLLERSEALLRAGRVDEAQADIRDLFVLQPNNGDAYALRAVLSVVRNDKAAALRDAQQATTLTPNAYRPWLALSYAQQADFKLEQALESAQKAAALAPNSALAQARVAELLMSLGRIREAEKAARQAVAAEPRQARGHVILGFVHLAQIDTKAARQDFNQAIELDSTDPLPRLGMGLAIIREGKLKEGREQIEIAVALDPTNSLIRSYVGKAYYEENTKERDTLAASQFSLAKELDPNDPTPWFYDAILKQTQNRPVEALEDLQKSIEINESRAVYRSRLLLDEDRAAREISLARTYTDMALREFAITEASKSLADDPSNHSAHRFLADTYSRDERQDIARVSELLQAQLLQPSAAYPVQPQAAFTDLNIAPSVLSTGPGLNEYVSLFDRNRLSLLASGLAGNFETLGDELALSGRYDLLSFGLGQFHYETEGFRPNNDMQEDIYNLFAQLTPNERVSFQLELRQRNTEQGDLALNGDPLTFDPSFRRTTRHDVQRLGAHVSPTPGHDFLLSVIHGKVEDDQQFAGPLTVNGTDQGDQVEGQYIWHAPLASIVAGLGWYDVDQQFGFMFDPICPPGACETSTAAHRVNGYVYGTLRPANGVRAVLGLSYDELDDANLSLRELNPKLGLQWQVNTFTSLRLAAFQVVRPTLLASQTIEPTQVVGFSQLFDDLNGTVSRRYAAAVDLRPRHDWFLSVEGSRRYAEDPFDTATTPFFSEVREDLAMASVSKTFAKRLIGSIAYFYEHYSRPVEDALAYAVPVADIKNQTIPMRVRYFAPTGFLGELSVTVVRQEVLNTFPTPGETTSNFTVVDAAIGYRFPRRRGLVSLEIRNLFDESFSYQNLSFQTNEPLTPRFVPARTILAKLALFF